MSDSELLQIADTVDAVLAAASAAEPQPITDPSAEPTLGLLSDAGLWRVALPESAGGSDGLRQHLGVVLKRLGFHAVDVPLLEDHSGAELLVAHGEVVPEGVLTVTTRQDLVAGQSDGQWVVSGRCRQVPWGRAASVVVAFAQSAEGPVLVLLPVGDAAVTPGNNVAGEPRDELVFDAVPAVGRIVPPDAPSALLARVLVYRALAMLGAGERALEMTITHVVDRTQFGRALAHRQVVQHYVAEMFGALTATRAAVDSAVAALEGGDTPGTYAAALATKVEADRMASLVARLAHQLHGAMGVTLEHPLHFATTRLASWRQDDFSETACAQELSRLVPGLGGPWKTLTDQRSQ